MNFTLSYGWGSYESGILQELWTALLQFANKKFGEDSLMRDCFLYVGVTYAIGVSFYWVIGVMWLPMDFWSWLRNKLLLRKCQPSKQITGAQVIKIMKYVGFQQVVFWPFALLAGLPFMRQVVTHEAELPDLTTVAWQIPMFLLATEVYFYYHHRAIHHPKVYHYIHKIHHEFTYPIALECLYSHPIENIVNFGTVAFGPILCRCHITMLYFWTAVSLLGILTHHSGWDVPFDNLGFGSLTLMHDYHHSRYNVNYGVIGLLDWLHGTNKGFQKFALKWEEEHRLSEMNRNMVTGEHDNGDDMVKKAGKMD